MIDGMKILDTKIGSAVSNMAFDRQLLEQLDPFGEPILHLYRLRERPSRAHVAAHFISRLTSAFDLRKAAEDQSSL